MFVILKDNNVIFYYRVGKNSTLCANVSVVKPNYNKVSYSYYSYSYLTICDITIPTLCIDVKTYPLFHLYLYSFIFLFFVQEFVWLYKV